ncbi:hypothetical protein PLICRDRAFT_488161 [Plicaturopsis crispa FD-325 SS-3]|nr:hypothetical protein PLICRDRAFT_488161 [Plicaturopsis crispa FD-325 SS-3]
MSPHHSSRTTHNAAAAPVATSSIRRKPQFTYQSPAADAPELRIEGSGSSSVSKLPSSSSSSSSSSSLASSLSKPTPLIRRKDLSHLPPLPKKKVYPMGPPFLPLYHPHGRLALSLPELDPESLGYSAPVVVDDTARRPSARSRRPAAKLRDVNDDTSPATPPPAPLLKERPSPRKRRPGGGGGKRKRVTEVDDAYPAKRVARTPRGAVEPEATAVVEPREKSEEKKPERRSTRARSALVRRDSSASEATAPSVAAGRNDDTAEAEVASTKASEEKDGEGKEDGELSEETRPSR